MLYRALLDDDGSLEPSLQGDDSFRARIILGFFRAMEDPENPRLAILAAETIADRLEGRPVQKAEALVIPQPIFWRAGDPPPPGVEDPSPTTVDPNGFEEMTAQGAR